MQDDSSPFPRSNGYPWFAVRVKSNREKVTSLTLRGMGLEDFLPVYRSVRRYSHRTRTAELPLFPGYVFGRFNPNDRLPVLSIPGVLHIVGISRVPAPVGKHEIEALRRVVESRLFAEPWPFLNVGERVVVDRGPLAGVEGIVMALKKGLRLVISVTLLQRSVAVEIDRDWVRPSRSAFELLVRRVAPEHFTAAATAGCPAIASAVQRS